MFTSFLRTITAAAAIAVLGAPWHAELQACCCVVLLAPEELVRQAAVIIRVRALSVCVGAHCLPPSAALVNEKAGPPAHSYDVDRMVEFEVIETLKGPAMPARVRLSGALLGHDRFHDRPVPYEFGRGTAGSCNPWDYRAGGEYLLMLRPRGTELTPNWEPGIASNEQLRADDPWLAWVRKTIARQQAGRP
jgi:hypothetical protein